MRGMHSIWPTSGWAIRKSEGLASLLMPNHKRNSLQKRIFFSHIQLNDRAGCRFQASNLSVLWQLNLRARHLHEG
jgi:hypothetical protein